MTDSEYSGLWVGSTSPGSEVVLDLGESRIEEAAVDVGVRGFRGMARGSLLVADKLRMGIDGTLFWKFDTDAA